MLLQLLQYGHAPQQHLPQPQQDLLTDAKQVDAASLSTQTPHLHPPAAFGHVGELHHLRTRTGAA
jgi:hypothetical protein